MADRLLLESGAPDGYLLEDGSGVIELEPYLHADDFNRTRTSGTGWGNDWSHSTSSTLLGVDGSRAYYANTGSTNKLNYVDPAVLSLQDLDIVGTFAIADLPAAGVNYTYTVVLRLIDTSNYYRLDITLLDDATFNLILRQVIGGTATTIGSTVNKGTYVAGADWKFRVQAEGINPTTLRLRIWNASGAEPGTWDREETNTAAALQAAGGFGTRLLPSAGTYITTAYLDDWGVSVIAAAGGDAVKNGTDAATGTEGAPTLGKPGTDTATGDDVVSVLGKPGVDSGAGSDDLSVLGKPGADTGAGQDLMSVLGKSGSDIGGGQDDAALGKPAFDTGAGTEAVTVLGMAVQETGSGTDDDVGHGMVTTETGAGTDDDAGRAIVLAPDTAAGSDATTVKGQTSTDTGTGSEEPSTPGFAVVTADTAAGSEPTTSRGASSTETGSGSDASVTPPVGAYQATDQAAADDQATLTYAIVTTDTAAGSDGFTVLAKPGSDTATGSDDDSGRGIAGYDQAAGSDAITGTSRLVADAGSGSDQTSSAGYSLADQGAGSEAVSGRAIATPDQATGDDSSQLTADGAFQRTDDGTATEAPGIITSAIQATDDATGSEISTPAFSPITGDTGSGSDGSLAAAAHQRTDQAGSIELATATSAVSGADQATGTDLATVGGSFVSSDLAAGSEAIYGRQAGGSDAGTSEDETILEGNADKDASDAGSLALELAATTAQIVASDQGAGSDQVTMVDRALRDAGSGSEGSGSAGSAHLGSQTGTATDTATLRVAHVSQDLHDLIFGEVADADADVVRLPRVTVRNFPARIGYEGSPRVDRLSSVPGGDRYDGTPRVARLTSRPRRRP